MLKLPRIEVEGLDGRIFSLWEGSMGELVGGEVDAGIAREVPEIIVSFERSLGGASEEMQGCLEAGLWLLVGDLERAHGICQDIATRYGAAWHAVMHRREGDFWNSKYWWRRASGVRWTNKCGTLHEELAKVFAELKLQAEVRELVVRGYNAEAFVDCVERLRGSGGAVVEALVAVQRMEWMWLFVECFEEARAGR